ncbi:hypothetical protein L228DRAFT_30062 [Xylona heveae TC161]|uniref:Sister chromatid cohesion protein Ctf8 n=1 Tax=Xylona heveae (strain CBS 132557 / TC161) TaxID=1328760 RepID=A0A165A1I6_XYLHT|nr:hypothetical protein L228DRAFT_30062 [Xylona heveae TC161]KZF19824.1 hypothetical protein L228DRAFT_30062 [Xylona heveae TC161]
MPSIPLYPPSHNQLDSCASNPSSASSSVSVSAPVAAPAPIPNPLPPLLHTPSGLAVIEMQGTINMPSAELVHDLDDDDDDDDDERRDGEEMEVEMDDESLAKGGQAAKHNKRPKSKAAYEAETAIGRLVFPYYSPTEPTDNKWMKRVHLYVGRHQRMTGEVKKLVNPLAVIRRRQQQGPVGSGKGTANEVSEKGADVDMDVDVDADTTRDGTAGENRNGSTAKGDDEEEELEIVDIVRYKILFSQRPEPVSG